jgi:hypothetical protein
MKVRRAGAGGRDAKLAVALYHGCAERGVPAAAVICRIGRGSGRSAARLRACPQRVGGGGSLAWRRRQVGGRAPGSGEVGDWRPVDGFIASGPIPDAEGRRPAARPGLGPWVGALRSRPRVALSSAQAPPVCWARRPPGNSGLGRRSRDGGRGFAWDRVPNQEDVQGSLPREDWHAVRGRRIAFLGPHVVVFL